MAAGWLCVKPQLLSSTARLPPLSMTVPTAVAAVEPARMVLARLAVPPLLRDAAAAKEAGLGGAVAAEGAVGDAQRAAALSMPPPPVDGAVAAEGAVGDGQRAT